MKNHNRPLALLSLMLLFISAQQALAFYNPQTGRWLNRDPIAEKGFNPVAANHNNLREDSISQARLQLLLSMQNKTIPSLMSWLFASESESSLSNGRREDWLREECNLNIFVQNEPVVHVDPFGLTIMYGCPSYRWCARCVITWQPSPTQLYYLAVNAQRLISCLTRSAGIMNLGCALASRPIFNGGCDAMADCLTLYSRQIWPPPLPGTPPGFP